MNQFFKKIKSNFEFSFLAINPATYKKSKSFFKVKSGFRLIETSPQNKKAASRSTWIWTNLNLSYILQEKILHSICSHKFKNDSHVPVIH